MVPRTENCHSLPCQDFLRVVESVMSLIRDRLFVVKVSFNATIGAKHNTINGINSENPPSSIHQHQHRRLLC
jgi:hypothetical protein